MATRDAATARFRRAYWSAFPAEGRTPLSEGAAEAWVRRIWRSPWLVRHVPTPDRLRGSAPAVVIIGGRPVMTGRMLRMGRHEANKPGVLHWLTHDLAQSRGHERAVAKLFLQLVQHFLGRAAGQQLRQAYVTHRVKYRQTRVLSEAERQALRVRAAHMRARTASRIVRRRLTLVELPAPVAPTVHGVPRRVRLRAED
jgi:hypothetical protein